MLFFSSPDKFLSVVDELAIVLNLELMVNYICLNRLCFLYFVIICMYPMISQDTWRQLLQFTVLKVILCTLCTS
jgi:hypothetical protein